MSPTDSDDVERAVLTELAGAGPPAVLCPSCLVASLKVDRQRLMAGLRRLMVRSLVEVRVNRCARCREVALAVRLPPSH
jgi:hypothetical protein